MHVRICRRLRRFRDLVASTVSHVESLPAWGSSFLELARLIGVARFFVADSQVLLYGVVPAATFRLSSVRSASLETRRSGHPLDIAFELITK